jgi:protein involved in polysaccharide export with SLBB domain
MNRPKTSAIPVTALRRSLLGLAVMLSAGSLEAQSSIGELRRQATRSELETAAKAAETASAQAPDAKTRQKLLSDAAALRQRLTNGDFLPGDRILIEVIGDSVLSDTFTVRGDRRLPLPDIDPISLQGVLDSELEPYLTKELGRYLKEVSLSATPLVRLQISGAIPQPNFYTVPVDHAITDVIAGAGGTGGVQTAVEKTVVRRSGSVFMDAKTFADAVRLGKTVGDMALRDGDEIYVPDRASSTFDWQKALQAVTAVTGAYFLIRYGLRGRFR